MISDSLEFTEPMTEIGSSGIYKHNYAAYNPTINYAILSYGDSVDLTNAENYVFATSESNDKLYDILGLVQSNHKLYDTIYDASGNLLTAKMTTYTNNALTGEIKTYDVLATYTDNTLTTYQVIEA